MYYITAEINSLNEYIDFIHNYQMNNKTKLWYRGQKNNFWTLDSTIDRNKELNVPPLGQIAELKYKNIPNFMHEIIALEKMIGSNMPKKYNRFHLMFLGQHYGLKTPALDWSTDPLVALYFALSGFVRDGEAYPVVFILKPSMLNENSKIQIGDKALHTPLNVDFLPNTIFNRWFSDINKTPFDTVPLAVLSNYNLSYRISRQSGVFTLMDARQPLNYPWIQTKINDETFGIAIKINPNKVTDIRKHLVSLNITRSTIYGARPNRLDNICTNINKNTPVI